MSHAPARCNEGRRPVPCPGWQRCAYLVAWSPLPPARYMADRERDDDEAASGNHNEYLKKGESSHCRIPFAIYQRVAKYAIAAPVIAPPMITRTISHHVHITRVQSRRIGTCAPNAKA